MKRFFLPCCILLLFSFQAYSAHLTSINIIDHHGMSQTISSKSRLAEFEKIDFCAPQSYQKVMRVYAKEKNGDVYALITSYHPNGQIKQYLEALNNRANGVYYEWFAHGGVKIRAHVIGGVADLNAQAEKTWLFDGFSEAWDDEGNFIAEIPYIRGELNGTAYYYHSNRSLWKEMPFYKGVPHGIHAIYCEDGSLLQTTAYENGIKEGSSFRYWGPETLAYEEHYCEGKLQEASYFSAQGECLATLHQGKGTRILFGKEGVCERQEYKEGEQRGTIEQFDSNGFLVSRFVMQEGYRHGESIDYYPRSTQPKISMQWQGGQLQGTLKTWFEEGTLQSQREMSQNKKNGLLMGWYRNGSLMLLEEYDNDRLLKGEYFRCNEKTPVSRVEKGEGTAYIFDAEGVLCQKVRYHQGWPTDDAP